MAETVGTQGTRTKSSPWHEESQPSKGDEFQRQADDTTTENAEDLSRSQSDVKQRIPAAPPPAYKILTQADQWQSGPDALNERDSWGRTALFEAIAQEEFKIARKLLDLGADARIADDRGISPLHVAVLRGNVEIVRKCIDMKADINAETKHVPAEGDNAERHVETPLWWCLYTSHPKPLELFQLMCSLGADVTIVRSDDAYPMIVAAAGTPNVELVKFLIDNNYGTVNDRAADGTTPLLAALIGGQAEMALMLIGAKADVNARDNYGSFALCIATVKGFVAVVRALLDSSADTTFTQRGLSALHMAASENQPAIAELILEKRSEKDVIDAVEEKFGYTPLIWALQQDNPEVAKLLIERGANITLATSSGWLPIHFLCSHCKDENLLHLYLRKYPTQYISPLNDFGSTPIGLAARESYIYAVDRLLDLGANLSTADQDGNTALMLAAFAESDELVEKIMAKPDCAPDKRNKDGWTALHIVSQANFGYKLVKDLTNMTRWQFPRRTVATPSVIAVAHNNVPALKALLAGGMPIDYTSDDGITPLHEAAGLEIDLVDALLEHEASKDLLSASNIVPYIVALAHRDEKVIAALKPDNIHVLNRRATYTLIGAVFQAAGYDQNTVSWMLDQGFYPGERNAWGYNALHLAVQNRNHEATSRLLDEPCMMSIVNSEAHLTKLTAVMIAVQSRSAECVRVLLEKGHADLRRQDVLGFSVFHYARSHPETMTVLKEFEPDLYMAWVNDRGDDRQDKLRRRLGLMLAWFRNLPDISIPQYRDFPPEAMLFDILAEMLFCLGEDEHARTSLERGYGRASRRLKGFLRCHICLTLKRRVGYVCATCPVVIMCASCRHNEEKVEGYGCKDHRLLDYPRDSLFDRDQSYVNDKDQTEEDWMKELIEKFNVKDLEAELGKTATDDDLARHIRTMAAAELSICWEYEKDRPDVFEFCRSGNWEDLKSHLAWFSRDVAVTDSQGDNMTMWVLRTSTDDDECLRILEMLSAQAVAMLARNDSGETSIKIACDKGFRNSLTFLLSHFDPEFNKIEDKHSSQSLRTILDNGWNEALRFAIERHFNWACRGEFQFLEELDRPGVSNDEIMEVIKDVHFAEAQDATQERPRIELIAFEQPTHENSVPAVDKHIVPSCVHNQCREGLFPEVVVRRLPEPELVPDIPDLWKEGIPEPDDISEGDDTTPSLSSGSESLSSIERAAYLCGFAGVFPDDEGCFSAREHGGIPAVFIRYNSDDPFNSRNALRILLKAGSGLLEAMDTIQKASLCCNAFTVLCGYGPTGLHSVQPIISLCRIPFETVVTFVTDLQQQAAVAEEKSTPFSLSLAGRSAFASIRKICSFYKFYEVSATEGLISCCTLMQFLCLGFLSFLRAHLASMELPTLRSSLPPVLLMGTGSLAGIAFRPRKLACAGRMIQESVFVFEEISDRFALDDHSEECQLLAGIEDILEIWGPGSCIFEKGTGTRSNHIIAVALRGGFLALTDHTSDQPRHAHWFPASASNEDDKDDEVDTRFPTTDGGFISLAEFFAGQFSHAETLLSFHADDQLLISGLHKSMTCLNGSDDEFRRRTYGHAQSERKISHLRTATMRWILENAVLNVGLQERGIGISAGMGLKRDASSHATKKEQIYYHWKKSQERIESRGWPWSKGDFEALSEPHGVVFSVCSNYAKRVPLREALAEGWLSFTEERPPWTGPRGWHNVRNEMFRRLKGSDARTAADADRLLKYFIRMLPPAMQNEIHFVLKELLEILMATGVTQGGSSFDISWPQIDERVAFRFQCTKPVNWVKLLQDTTEIATFAIVTHDCLVERGTEHRRCRNRGLEFVRLSALHLLDTKIVPLQGGSRGWQIPKSSCYFVSEAPSSDRSALLTTKMACRVDWFTGDEADLYIVPAAEFHAGWYKLFRVSEAVREAEHRLDPEFDIAKAVIVTSTERWRET